MMKIKRVFFAVLFGLLFSPVALAESPFDQFESRVAGEMGPHQIDYRASQCQFADMINVSAQSGGESASGRGGAAGVAH